MLGDVHGGAGEQCAELYYDIARRMDAGAALEDATVAGLDAWRAQYGKIVSGFGHRFHKPIDPRAPRLMDLVRRARKRGGFRALCRYRRSGSGALEHEREGRALAMNIDGATAVIFCELGLPAPLSRGLFCLSRSVGILAHAWEQMGEGRRNKGPMPPSLLPLYQPREEG